MNYFNRKGAVAALLGALALLSGCGSNKSNNYQANSPYGFTGGGGVIGGGTSGCFRPDQPVPFTVNNAYLSGVQMCTGGSSLSCPSNSGAPSIGGGGATQAYFVDVAVDGAQSVRMDIVPYSSYWAPNSTVPPMTANARGTFQIGPTMLGYLQARNGGVLPCVTRVLAVNTAFDPSPGAGAGRTTLYSTRIVIQWQGNAASGTDELAF